ncbi:MAG: aldo/keto reductase [Anaerolineales bacterium]|nr:aldo/keto reductase [Anaerolineales bacterium]
MDRKLGKSMLSTSALGMGCWAIGGPWTWAQPGREPFPAGWGQIDDEESIRAIHAALDAGVSFFDTAANYGAGHSEKVLGEALRGRRDQVVIATKFGHIIDEQAKTVYADNDQILDNVRSDLEGSLQRLDTDSIDIYQLHEGGYDVERAEELRGRLEDFVQEGKIRWYGWSTDLVDRAAVFAEGDHCTSIQFRLNALFDHPEMRQLCADHDLAGINKDPLNRGVLTGKFSPESSFPDDDIRSAWDMSEEEMRIRLRTVEALREVFTADGRTMAQGAIGYIWALDDRMVPIPGFKTVSQVLENAAAMEYGPLSEAQMRQIETIVADFQLEVSKS